MFRRIYGIVLGVALGGCAITQSTEEVVLDYNKSFAATRNEMLLLNVLRSAAREPMQFSTMGQVQGAIGNGGQLTIPINNFIGGKNIVSPSFQFTDSVNPQVSIIPLASKEFAEGILRPIKTDTLQLFMHNGWDPEFLLPLVVGGVVCPDGRLIRNGGDYLDSARTRSLSDAFKRFFDRAAKTISVSSGHTGKPVRYAFTLSDKEAMTVLKDGVGGGYSVIEVVDGAAGQKRVTVETAKGQLVSGVDVRLLCDQVGGESRTAGERLPDFSDLPGAVEIRDSGAGSESLPPCCQAAPAKQGLGRLVFRSPAAIIHYLGESHRVRVREDTVDRAGLLYLNGEGTEQVLFRAGWGLSNTRKVVSVPFHGQPFHIEAIDLRRGEGADRTLKTLSFLDQLIALQTNESAIRGTAPILAVTQ
jgi:hypothetical protein